MSKQLTSLDEKATFLEASKLLEKQKVIPVLKSDKLLGIVTEKDLFRVIQKELFEEEVTVRLGARSTHKNHTGALPYSSAGH